MIFCKVEVALISLVRNSFDQFRVASGLSLNLDKSSMFLCGVEPDTKLQLIGALGYREGKLRVRYLRVPLITKKLSSYDCLILMDRLMAKARSWLNRYLSYAGRLQLLNSILFFLFRCIGLLFLFFLRLLLRK
jgi:hypothetical protein